MNPQDDAIAAIVTPIGEGGLAILRVSGPRAVEIADGRFRGKSSLAAAATHTAHFGHFVDCSGEVLDEVVATVFRAPHSYTAEDTVEFSCHGGIYISRKILESLLRSGARAAEPGEFTKRAFLNGRIDLSQAEAVADLIRSRSEASLRVSLKQLEGRLSQRIKKLREKILNLCGLLELELDFAEEGLQLADKSKINKDLSGILDEISELANSYRYGKLYREGVHVVLVGRPNVGKSSILNSLLSEDRAIVTEIPGTTRDVIQESLNIGGLLFMVTDTAGLRRSEDSLEIEGIRRTRKEICEADIIVSVVEAGAVSDDDWRLVKLSKEESRKGSKFLVAVNKIDLAMQWRIELPDGNQDLPVCYMSAKSGEGLDSLRRSLVDLASLGNGSSPEASAVVTNERQKSCLLRAADDLVRARNDLLEGKSNEFIALNLRAAVDNLGEIIGAVTTDDILNNVFVNFCIGK
jgi:tRNA modification GTPase